MQIYLDYSATTPCRPEAIAKMQEALTHQWGNPSSLHHWGERAATLLEEARYNVGQLINAPDNSISFTSGGTESNNIAIFGIAAQYSEPKHLIISSVEHSAISQPARVLQRQGWKVSLLPVNQEGRISPEVLEKTIQDDTALISIIYGQSEVGTIQPIAELSAIAHQHGIIFHTDAVQAAGRVPIDVQAHSIDLLSLSSHKIYGPQGAGAIYINPNIKLHSLVHGGGQEHGIRPGTQSIPSIAGFGTAADLAGQEMDTENQRLTKLRELLFENLAHCSYLIPTGDRSHRLPHHVSFAIKPESGPFISGRDIVRVMNRAGIGISAGSACNSGKTVPSSVLKAMGFGDELAKAGLRLTLGKQTTEQDIQIVTDKLQEIISQQLETS